MGAVGMAIAGGLLKGLGAGITNMQEERRAAALDALKRQDADLAYKRERADKLADTEAAFGRQKELLTENAKLDEKKIEAQSRGRLAEAQVKHEQNVSLKLLEDKLQRGRTAAEIRLREELANGDVQSSHTGEDGSLVVVYKDGRSEVKSDIKLHRTLPKKDEDEPEASISSERAERQPAAQPAPQTGLNANEKARFATIYASARPDTHPQLFRNGQKIPLPEAMQMVERQLRGR